MCDVQKIRAPHKVHVLSWVLALDKHGSVPCHFKNCKFMALSVDEMANHYTYCKCKNDLWPFTCNICQQCTNAFEKLIYHKIYAHSYNATPDELSALAAFQNAPVKKEVSATLRRGWQMFFQNKGFYKCFQRPCLFVADNLEDLEEHHKFYCSEKYWKDLKFECRYCHGKFLSNSKLEAHCRSFHNQKNDALQTFKDSLNEADLLKGWAECIIMDKYAKCPVPHCRFVCNSISSLEKHYKFCNGEQKTNVACPKCGCWVQNMDKLIEHKKVIHKDWDDADFMCKTEPVDLEVRTWDNLQEDPMFKGADIFVKTNNKGILPKKYEGKQEVKTMKYSRPLPKLITIPATKNSIDYKKSNTSNIQFSEDVIDINSATLDVVNIDSANYAELFDIAKDQNNLHLSGDKAKLKSRTISSTLIPKRRTMRSKSVPTPLENVVQDMMCENKFVPTIPIQIKIDNVDLTVNVPHKVTQEERFPSSYDEMRKALRRDGLRILQSVSRDTAVRSDIKKIFDPFHSKMCPFSISIKEPRVELDCASNGDSLTAPFINSAKNNKTKSSAIQESSKNIISDELKQDSDIIIKENVSLLKSNNTLVYDNISGENNANESRSFDISDNYNDDGMSLGSVDSYDVNISDMDDNLSADEDVKLDKDNDLNLETLGLKRSVSLPCNLAKYMVDMDVNLLKGLPEHILSDEKYHDFIKMCIRPEPPKDNGQEENFKKQRSRSLTSLIDIKPSSDNILQLIEFYSNLVKINKKEEGGVDPSMKSEEMVSALVAQDLVVELENDENCQNVNDSNPESSMKHETVEKEKEQDNNDMDPELHGRNVNSLESKQISKNKGPNVVLLTSEFVFVEEGKNYDSEEEDKAEDLTDPLGMPSLSKTCVEEIKEENFNEEAETSFQCTNEGDNEQCMENTYILGVDESPGSSPSPQDESSTHSNNWNLEGVFMESPYKIHFNPAEPCHSSGSLLDRTLGEQVVQKLTSTDLSVFNQARDLKKNSKKDETATDGLYVSESDSDDPDEFIEYWNDGDKVGNSTNSVFDRENPKIDKAKANDLNFIDYSNNDLTNAKSHSDKCDIVVSESEQPKTVPDNCPKANDHPLNIVCNSDVYSVVIEKEDSDECCSEDELLITPVTKQYQGPQSSLLKASSFKLLSEAPTYHYNKTSSDSFKVPPEITSHNPICSKSIQYDKINLNMKNASIHFIQDENRFYHDSIPNKNPYTLGETNTWMIQDLSFDGEINLSFSDVFCSDITETPFPCSYEPSTSMTLAKESIEKKVITNEKEIVHCSDSTKLPESIGQNIVSENPDTNVSSNKEEMADCSDSTKRKNVDVCNDKKDLKNTKTNVIINKELKQSHKEVTRRKSLNDVSLSFNFDRGKRERPPSGYYKKMTNCLSDVSAAIASRGSLLKSSTEPNSPVIKELNLKRRSSVSSLESFKSPSKAYSCTSDNKKDRPKSFEGGNKSSPDSAGYRSGKRQCSDMVQDSVISKRTRSHSEGPSVLLREADVSTNSSLSKEMRKKKTHSLSEENLSGSSEQKSFLCQDGRSKRRMVTKSDDLNNTSISFDEISEVKAQKGTAAEIGLDSIQIGGDSYLNNITSNVFSNPDIGGKLLQSFSPRKRGRPKKIIVCTEKVTSDNASLSCIKPSLNDNYTNVVTNIQRGEEQAPKNPEWTDIEKGLKHSLSNPRLPNVEKEAKQSPNNPRLSDVEKETKQSLNNPRLSDVEKEVKQSLNISKLSDIEKDVEQPLNNPNPSDVEKETKQSLNNPRLSDVEKEVKQSLNISKLSDIEKDVEQPLNNPNPSDVEKETKQSLNNPRLSDVEKEVKQSLNISKLSDIEKDVEQPLNNPNPSDVEKEFKQSLNNPKLSDVVIEEKQSLNNPESLDSLLFDADNEKQQSQNNCESLNTGPLMVCPESMKNSEMISSHPLQVSPQPFDNMEKQREDTSNSKDITSYEKTSWNILDCVKLKPKIQEPIVIKNSNIGQPNHNIQYNTPSVASISNFAASRNVCINDQAAKLTNAPVESEFNEYNTSSKGHKPGLIQEKPSNKISHTPNTSEIVLDNKRNDPTTTIVIEVEKPVDQNPPVDLANPQYLANGESDSDSSTGHFADSHQLDSDNGESSDELSSLTSHDSKYVKQNLLTNSGNSENNATELVHEHVSFETLKDMTDGSTNNINPLPPNFKQTVLVNINCAEEELMETESSNDGKLKAVNDSKNIAISDNINTLSNLNNSIETKVPRRKPGRPKKSIDKVNILHKICDNAVSPNLDKMEGKHSVSETSEHKLVKNMDSAANIASPTGSNALSQYDNEQETQVPQRKPGRPKKCVVKEAPLQSNYKEAVLSDLDRMEGKHSVSETSEHKLVRNMDSAANTVSPTGSNALSQYDNEQETQVHQRKQGRSKKCVVKDAPLQSNYEEAVLSDLDRMEGKLSVSESSTDNKLVGNMGYTGNIVSPAGGNALSQYDIEQGTQVPRKKPGRPKKSTDKEVPLQSNFEGAGLPNLEIMEEKSLVIKSPNVLSQYNSEQGNHIPCRKPGRPKKSIDKTKLLPCDSEETVSANLNSNTKEELLATESPNIHKSVANLDTTSTVSPVFSTATSLYNNEQESQIARRKPGRPKKSIDKTKLIPCDSEEMFSPNLNSNTKEELSATESPNIHKSVQNLDSANTVSPVISTVTSLYNNEQESQIARRKPGRPKKSIDKTKLIPCDSEEIVSPNLNSNTKEELLATESPNIHKSVQNLDSANTVSPVFSTATSLYNNEQESQIARRKPGRPKKSIDKTKLIPCDSEETVSPNLNRNTKEELLATESPNIHKSVQNLDSANTVSPVFSTATSLYNKEQESQIARRKPGRPKKSIDKTKLIPCASEETVSPNLNSNTKEELLATESPNIHKSVQNLDSANTVSPDFSETTSLYNDEQESQIAHRKPGPKKSTDKIISLQQNYDGAVSLNLGNSLRKCLVSESSNKHELVALDSVNTVPPVCSNALSPCFNEEESHIPRRKPGRPKCSIKEKFLFAESLNMNSRNCLSPANNIDMCMSKVGQDTLVPQKQPGVSMKNVDQTIPLPQNSIECATPDIDSMEGKCLVTEPSNGHELHSNTDSQNTAFSEYCNTPCQVNNEVEISRRKPGRPKKGDVKITQLSFESKDKLPEPNRSAEKMLNNSSNDHSLTSRIESVNTVSSSYSIAFCKYNDGQETQISRRKPGRPKKIVDSSEEKYLETEESNDHKLVQKIDNANTLSPVCSNSLCQDINVPETYVPRRKPGRPKKSVDKINSTPCSSEGVSPNFNSSTKETLLATESPNNYELVVNMDSTNTLSSAPFQPSKAQEISVPHRKPGRPKKSVDKIYPLCNFKEPVFPIINNTEETLSGSVSSYNDKLVARIDPTNNVSPTYNNVLCQDNKVQENQVPRRKPGRPRKNIDCNNAFYINSEGFVAGNRVSLGDPQKSSVKQVTGVTLKKRGRPKRIYSNNTSGANITGYFSKNDQYSKMFETPASSNFKLNGETNFPYEHSIFHKLSNNVPSSVLRSVNGVAETWKETERQQTSTGTFSSLPSNSSCKTLLEVGVSVKKRGRYKRSFSCSDSVRPSDLNIFGNAFNGSAFPKSLSLPEISKVEYERKSSLQGDNSAKIDLPEGKPVKKRRGRPKRNIGEKLLDYENDSDSEFFECPQRTIEPRRSGRCPVRSKRLDSFYWSQIPRRFSYDAEEPFLTRSPLFDKSYPAKSKLPSNSSPITELPNVLSLPCSDISPITSQTPQIPRKRGRPRKNIIPEVVSETACSISENVANKFLSNILKTRSKRMKLYYDKVNNLTIGEGEISTENGKEGAFFNDLSGSASVESSSIRSRKRTYSQCSEDSADGVSSEHSLKIAERSKTPKRPRGNPNWIKKLLPMEPDILLDELDDYTDETSSSRKNTSGRIDALTKLYNPKLMVKCAVCGEEMTAIIYKKRHLLKHNFIAWLEGEEPLPLDDMAAMEKFLNRGKRVFPKFVFQCEECGECKRSVKGFLSHRQFCGKSREERERLMVQCSYCGRIMMPSSMEPHMYQCHMYQSSKIDASITEPVEGTRAAAAKCLDKIADYIESEKRHLDKTQGGKKKSERSDKNDGDFTVPEATNIGCLYERVKRRPTKHIKFFWKQAEESGVELSCTIPTCTYKSNTYDGMLFHFRACPAENLGFTCKKCNYINKNEELMCEHVKLCNPSIEFGLSDEEIYEKCDKIPYLNAAESKYAANKFHFFKPALAWTKNIHEEQLSSTPLYESYQPNHEDWLQVSESEQPKYLPESKRSVSVQFSDTPAQEINTFEGKVSKESGCIGYCGGPIWGLSWCPGSGEQIVAISTHLSMESSYQIGSTYTGPGLLQLWSIGEVNNLQNSRIESVRMLYGLCHEEKGCWDLAWLPSGGRTDTRLGLLALATTSGSIPIYSLPKPHLLPLDKSRFFKLKPVLKLELSSSEKWQCSAISWSKIKPHRIVAGGFVNGVIAVWDISMQSKLLKKNNILHPFKVFQAHNSFITSICLSPENEEYLASTSFDKSFKFWDLKDTTEAQSITRRGLITSADWLRHWMMAVTSYDIAYTLSQTTVGMSAVRGFLDPALQVISTTNSTSWSVSANDWLNCIAASYDNGQVAVTFALKHILTGSKDKRKYTKILVNSDLFEVCKNENADEEGKSSSSDQSDTVTSLTSYNNSVKKYGLNIKTDFTVRDFGQWDALKENTSEGMIDIYPLTSINKVAWNPNEQSFLHLAMGYQSGLFLISKLNFPFRDQALIDSVSSSTSTV